MPAVKDKYTELTTLFCQGLTGDQLAYARFLKTITPLLTRLCVKKLASSETDDVVQEILISIHKARHTYDGKRPIMPWIFSIAKFRITDHLRKHYAQMRNMAVDIADFENILADVTERSDSNESIEELLHDVPEKQRKILNMMHVEGYTAKQVGSKLGMKESAVKVAAHRAIKKIREQFNG